MLKVQWVKRAICLKSGFVAITRFQTFVHQFLPKVEIFPSQLISVQYEFLSTASCSRICPTARPIN